MVELAISSIFLLLLVMGIIDFGFLYGDKIAIENAVRAGARYGSMHATSWSNAASPDLSTIQGQTLQAGGVSSIPNQDGKLTVSYYDTSGASAVYCGKYVATSNSFSAASGYTQSTCVVDGNLVQVQIDYSYPVLTPLISAYFSPTIHVSAVSAFAVQQ
jgi:Flp pilus assembly protein TadG